MDELVSQAFSSPQPHLPLRGCSPASLCTAAAAEGLSACNQSSWDLQTSVIWESPAGVMAGPSGNWWQDRADGGGGS